MKKKDTEKNLWGEKRFIIETRTCRNIPVLQQKKTWNVYGQKKI